MQHPSYFLKIKYWLDTPKNLLNFLDVPVRGRGAEEERDVLTGLNKELQVDLIVGIFDIQLPRFQLKVVDLWWKQPTPICPHPFQHTLQKPKPMQAAIARVAAGSTTNLMPGIDGSYRKQAGKLGETTARANSVSIRLA
jgi:hypothetical protein